MAVCTSPISSPTPCPYWSGAWKWVRCCRGSVTRMDTQICPAVGCAWPPGSRSRHCSNCCPCPSTACPHIAECLFSLRPLLRSVLEDGTAGRSPRPGELGGRCKGIRAYFLADGGTEPSSPVCRVHLGPVSCSLSLNAFFSPQISARTQTAPGPRASLKTFPPSTPSGTRLGGKRPQAFTCSAALLVQQRRLMQRGPVLCRGVLALSILCAPCRLMILTPGWYYLTGRGRQGWWEH